MAPITFLHIHFLFNWMQNFGIYLQTQIDFFRSRDGAVARALASHQLNVEFGCCWFSSLLREVFPRVLRLSPLLKIQHFQITILAWKSVPNKRERAKHIDT